MSKLEHGKGKCCQYCKMNKRINQTGDDPNNNNPNPKSKRDFLEASINVTIVM